MAQKIEVILKGDALEDVREAFKANRKVRLEGNQNLFVEQEGGEGKYYDLGQYHIVPGRTVLCFGKE